MGDGDLKGAYNRAPFFYGKNYAYLMENMYVLLISVDKHLSVAITDRPFIPKSKVYDYVKISKNLTDDETKKASYDLKVRNIVIFELRSTMYYFI